MNEQNTGMEPEVRLYFRKIMKTVGAILLWAMTMATVGLFMKWAYITTGLRWQSITFYILFLLTLGLILRFLFRVWAKRT